MAAPRHSVILVILILLGACARPGALADSTASAPPQLSNPPASRATGDEESSIRWSHFTHSPNPGSVDPELAGLLRHCGEFDARLGAAATWLAKRGPLGQSDDEVEQLTFALRAYGSPYVRPVAWTQAAQAGTDADPIEAMELWLQTREPSPLRRCGVARQQWQGRSMTAVVVSSALAELVKPLPTRARVGQWLEVLAEMNIEASAAKVVLLGPDGDPRGIPTEMSGRSVRARFPAAMPGRWMVQVMADVRGGPRQVLEALLFVDETPPATHQPENAPGERPPKGNESAEQALFEMLAELRHRTRRPALRRDPILDRLASTHAESMRRAGRIGHDVGYGSTTDRLAAANFVSRLAGENVAHASDTLRVHRALWASPSHRSNLLNRSFSRFGLGVIEDSDGSLWVCELFASEN